MNILEKILKQTEDRRMSYKQDLEVEVGGRRISELKERISELNWIIKTIRAYMGEDVSKKSGWIPTSERLPENDERYKGRKVIDVLVTTATGKVTKVQRQLTYKDIWVWGRIYGVPKAWQPLPEPYKGE